VEKYQNRVERNIPEIQKPLFDKVMDFLIKYIKIRVNSKITKEKNGSTSKFQLNNFKNG